MFNSQMYAFITIQWHRSLIFYKKLQLQSIKKMNIYTLSITRMVWLKQCFSKRFSAAHQIAQGIFSERWEWNCVQMSAVDDRHWKLQFLILIKYLTGRIANFSRMASPKLVYLIELFEFSLPKQCVYIHIWLENCVNYENYVPIMALQWIG